MNLTRIENESPFDAIRHFDDNGKECWYARELMTLMGYKQWRSFKQAIDVALENIELVGDSTEGHIADVTQKTQGRDAEDFKLSRYGAYMTALACDRKKVQVALAKKYFAVKTYEAETKSQSKNNLELTPELVTNTIDLIFKGVNIKPELIAGVKLNAIQRLSPALAETVQDSSKLLRENTACQFTLMTPTELGKKIGVSAIAVNKRLISAGLQVKNETKKSRKEPAYFPTDKGHEFCSFTLSGGNDDTTYQQLLWYESVLNVIS